MIIRVICGELLTIYSYEQEIFFTHSACTFTPVGAASAKAPQDMDRFLDDLLKRMTLEEKIGQLNLPVTGEITTGQAKSSDIMPR